MMSLRNAMASAALAVALLAATPAHALVEKLHWNTLAGAGATVSARSGAAIAANDTHVLIHGGDSPDGNSGNLSPDYVISMADGTWTEVTRNTGGPPARAASLAAGSGSFFYAYGGYAWNANDNSLHITVWRGELNDDNSVTYNTLTQAGTGARGAWRRNAPAVYLPRCEDTTTNPCLVVFGGQNRLATSFYSDTRVLRTLTNTPTWFLPGAASTNHPPAAIDASFDVDATGTGAVLFGGRTGTSSSTATNQVHLFTSSGFPTRPETHGNIALATNGKTATQSSTYASYGASRVIDGDIGGRRMDSNKCAHTGSQTDPWIQIDLKRSYSVSKIVIENRVDWDPENRIRGFEVWVSDKPDIADVLAEGFICPNPYDSFLATAEIPCVTAGRYVTLRIPGNNRLIQVCEIEVWAERRWTWAQLTGTEEVAANKPTRTSSSAYTGGANAFRAVDGNTDGRWASASCTHTNNEPNPWWSVDLLESREIETVQIWDRTDSCCNSRLTNFQIRVGFGTRWEDAALCKTVATIGTSGTYVCDTPLVGRTVFVVMPSTANRALTLCEVKVFARKLRNVPAPRYAHAHAAARGMVFYFGGIGSDGNALDDFAAFDTAANEFRAAGSMIGIDVDSGYLSPTARSFSMMIATSGPAAELALVGGRNGGATAEQMIDVHRVAFRACPAMTAVDSGVDTTTCERGSCYYTCESGYSDVNVAFNKNQPSVCTPEGTFIGSNTIPFCQPPPPQAPTAVTAVAGQESAVVSWTAPAAGTAVEAYRVTTLEPSFIDHFTGTSLSEGWTFVGGGEQGNRAEVIDGSLVASARAGTNCWESWNTRCLRVLRKPPTTLTGSYTVEFRVKFDPSYITDNVFGGIVFWNEASGYHGIYAGLRRRGGIFEFNAESAQVSYTTRTVSSDILSVQVTYSDPDGLFSLYYREQDTDELGNEVPWTLAYGRLSAPSVPGGALQDGRWSFGPMIKTWGGDAKFLWDYISITPGDCSRVGSQRVVPAGVTSTTVYGLQPNQQTTNPTYPYTFKVEAKAVNGGWGPAGVSATAVAPTVDASDDWVNVARNPNAVARQSTTAFDGPASAAIDDEVVYVPPSGHIGCTHSAWEYQPFWTVDLGQKEDIEYILVTGRNDCCQDRLWGFELWIGDNGNSYNGEGNTRCSPNKVPWSWSNENNGKVPIFCGLSGRHVWIRLTNWNYLTLCGVEVFAPTKCPNDRAVGGADLRSGTDCTAATSGSTCNARCPTGYSVVAGSETSTCTLGEWSDAPLRCEKVCDRLVGPAGAAVCEQSLFSEDFSDNSTALSRFIPADPIERALGDVFIAADGYLVVAGDEACNSDSVLLAADDGVKGTQGRTLTRVRVHSDNKAGVVFRALNQNNMYAALLDYDSFEHVVLVVQDGVTTELDRRRFAIRPQEWHTITADAFDKYVVVTVDDSIQLFNVTSVHLATGASGVWSLGSARFDDFSVSVPCPPPADGTSVGECSRAAAGDTCSFTCRNGFEPSGSASRTCVAGSAGATNSWTGTQFNCKIRPPIVQDANRTVDENSPRGTAVGAPVPAELEADGEQMQFAIIGGNLGNAFRIDLCSGLITVNNQNALDFETTPVFELTVDVSVSGYADSNASATVRVSLQDVDEPPTLSDARLNVSEAAAHGTYIGKVTGFDQEGDALGYEASFDQSQGLISVDRATGMITLDRAALSAEQGAAILDFEADTVAGPKLLMIIDAYQTNNTALRASAFITIDILDANDAPRLTPGQVLTIDETQVTSATVPSTIPTRVAATDDDVAAFASPLTFAFVTDSASGKLVGNVTTFAGTVVNSILTTDGTASGADLFTLNASTGAITVANTPAGITQWTSQRSFLTSTGILARREFVFAMRVSDQPIDGGSLSSTGTVTAVIDANITAEPVIERVALAYPGEVQQGVVSGLLSTRGGEIVNITGRSLVGEVSAAWISKQRTDLPGAPWRGFNLTNCETLSLSLVQCETPAGWGTNLDLHLVIGGTRAIRGAVLALSYSPPTIDSIDFADSLPTRGGPTAPVPPATGAAQPITIRGSNLGPVGVPVRFEFVSVSSFESALAGTVAWQQCIGTSVTVSSATVQCTAPPGAGRDLAWRYVVDSDPVDGSAQYNSDTAGDASTTLLAYAGPVISSVAISPASNGGSLDALDTMGGEVIRITGDNFGPLGTDTEAKLTFAYDSPVRASSPMLAAVQLPLESCSRPMPASVHTVIDCVLPAGAGQGLVVDLTIASQSLFGAADSTNTSVLNITGATTDLRQRLDYAGPVITSVSGPGASGASTRGGEQVVIRGSNLGPTMLSSFGSVESVVYGAGRMPAYTALDCRVTQSVATGSLGGEQIISCLTAEGVGAGHSWRVQIASQMSPWNDADTSYGAPIVASFGDVGSLDANTRGNEAISIHGSNFGPAALVNALTGMAKLHVEYSVVLTDLTTAALQAAQAATASMQTDAAGAADDGLRVNFTAMGCTVEQDHTLIGCTTAPGAGAALAWSVTIDSQLSRSPTTNYAPPQIDSIALFEDEAMTTPVALANPNGGTWALLTGDYFGPSAARLPNYAGTTSLIQRVSTGPSGTEYVPMEVRHLDHSRVVIRLPAGYGEGLAAQLAVADQDSAVSSATFDYARPVLVSLTPSNADTSRPLGSSAPAYVVVEAQNLPIQDPSVSIVIVFGRVGRGQVVLLPTPFANEGDSIAANGNQRVRFALPAHAAGVDVPVKLGVVSASLAAAAAANGSTISPASVRFESPCDTVLDGAAGAPACLFRFNAPIVESVALSRPAWAGGSNRTDAVEPCPFGMAPAVTCRSEAPSSEVFRCDSGTIRRITFSGRSFGSETADNAFGTDRCLELDTRSALGLGGQLFSAADVFVSRWDDNRVVAYIDFNGGLVRMTVRTPEDNAGVEQLQQVQQQFTTESPSIARREGAFEDIPTAGGRVLTLYAPELDKFSSVQVHVASSLSTPAPLELLDLDGQYKAMALDHTRFATVQELGETLYVVRFKAPPGHGTGVRVILRGYTAGSPVDSDTAAELSYTAPSLSSVDVGVFDSVTGAMSWQAVPEDVGRFTIPARTLGTFVRLRGANFGPCAKAFVGAGAQYGTYMSADTAFCSAVPAVDTDGFNASWASPVVSRQFDRITPCDAADGTVHECVVVPIPPGEGTGITTGAAGSTGFQVQLSAASRTTNDPSLGADAARVALLRYMAPTVLSVARAGSASALPTRGGVPIRVTGFNFGELPPLGDPSSTALAVRVGRRDLSTGAPQDGFLWALDCTSPRRLSHSAIECTLPEGAGEALDVEVRVAGQASLPTDPGSLTYSLPFVGAVIVRYNDTHEECVRTSAAASSSMAPGGTMPWPSACMSAVSDGASNPGELRLGNIPTSGGINVTVLGENFARRGLRVPVCVFASWEGATLDPVCEDDGTDMVESSVGEGQLPPSSVFMHDHNMIKFQLPAGAGARRLDVLVGGARLAPSSVAGSRRELSRSDRSLATSTSRPLLDAARPVITAIAPAIGSTRGGTRLSISGLHFGPDKSLFNASVGGSAIVRDEFVDPANPAVSRPISASLATSAPTHYLVVHFGRRCVSNSQLAREYGCEVGGVVSQDDSTIVFETPGGVGVNKAVKVEIVDARFQPGGGEYLSAGPGAMFSYNPPRVITANPRTIMMNGDGSRKRVEILGDDFGGVPPDPCTPQTCWTDEEKELSLQIGSVDCVDSDGNPKATRKIEQGTTAVLCDLEPQLVGAKNLSLQIAGQGDFVQKTDIFRAVQMVCGSGAFGRPGESCIECPVGATCSGYVAELVPENATLNAISLGLGPGEEDPTPHTYPSPDFGFYNLNSSDSLSSGMLADCPSSNRIGSRDVCIVRCDPPGACIGDNFCGVGYASTERYNYRCNDCAEGYYRRNNGNCDECPQDVALLIVVFALVVIVASILAYYLASKNIALFLPTVALDYFQILALFANSRATWPPFISDLLDFFSAFLLDLNITAPECIAPNLGFTFRYGVTMALPLAAAALFTTMFVANYLWARIIKRQTKASACAASNTLIAMGLTGGYVLYVQLARTMFASLACSPNNPPEFDEAGNVIEYLQVVPEPCSKPGGVHQTLLPFTIIGLLVYIVGYPAFVAYKLISKRRLVVEDQLLRCKGVGDSESTNPNALHMRKRYSRIYYAFAPNFAPYWLHVLLMRKLLLAATALVFVRTPSWQLTLGLLVLFVAYALQVRYRPWLATSDREKHLTAHRIRALVPGSIDNRIASTIATAESGLRKRSTFGSGLDASSARARAMQIGTVIYGSVLNNPNTFDSVLLTCGILVAIGGLLFESDRFASELPFYDSQRDTLGALVGTVIIFGVVYAVFVIGLEFAALIRNSGLTEAQRAREAAKKAKDAKKKGGDGSASTGISVVPSSKLADAGGPVDLMNNPMMMQKADPADGRGLVMHTDAAADAIASITGKPDEQTWAIFKDAFLKLRAQVGELTRTNIEMERRYEAAAGAGAGTRASRSGSAAAAIVGSAAKPSRRQFAQVRATDGPDGTGKAAGASKSRAGSMRGLAGVSTGRDVRSRSRSKALLEAKKKNKAPAAAIPLAGAGAGAGADAISNPLMASKPSSE